MTDIQFGPEITPDPRIAWEAGKRPEWLSDADRIGHRDCASGDWYGTDSIAWRAKELDEDSWSSTDAIRLPADHPAYTAINAGKQWRDGAWVDAEPTIPAGMKPWHGGDSAPDDWDGGEVRSRDRIRVFGDPQWNHIGASTDIIGYTPTEPTPDTVSIQRMTEAEAMAWYRDVRHQWANDGRNDAWGVSCLRALGLIKPDPDTPEEIATAAKHGVSVETVRAIREKGL